MVGEETKKLAKCLSVAPHVTSQAESFLLLLLCYAPVNMCIILPCLVTWHLADLHSLLRVLAQHISSGVFHVCTASKILNSILESRLSR